MKQLLKKWDSISLVKRIVCGLVIGALLALFVPGIAAITLLGSLFVGALRAVAPVLVFLLVISALAQAKTGGGNMGRVVVLYLLGTFLAALTAVIAAFLFPIDITLPEAVSDYSAASGIGAVLKTLLMNVVENPVSAIANANFIGILAWAAVFGVALRKASDTTKQVLSNLSSALTQAVRWIISCAPFGILGLVYTAVSENGMSIFTEYGKLLLLLVGCMLVIALVVNPIIVFCNTRANPYPLVFKCLKESGITAFFTRSSAANIPVNMELCEKLHLDEDNYSVSIPLGATDQHGRRGRDHHCDDAGRGAHAGHCGGFPHGGDPERAGCGVGLRRFRRGRRLAAADPSGLLPVRHSQRHCHAGRGRGLHHRRDPGLLRNGAELLHRRAVHRQCGVCRLAQGGTPPAQDQIRKAAARACGKLWLSACFFAGKKRMPRAGCAFAPRML